MRTTVLLAALAGATAIAFSFPALAADNAQDFVNKAAVGGMFEVESSKLADTAAHDDSVKDFAHMMITDHTAANTKLEQIANEQKLSVPSALDAEHQAVLDKLNSAKGGSFDQAYVQAQHDAHDEAVSLFEGYAKDGDNASLKAFANETLPTLKMHQDKIQHIAMDEQPKTKVGTDVSSDTDDAAPVPGANSFTEDQAKTRIQEAGYSDVSGLAKDDKGIWRGQAKKDGKGVPVALDFKGNVTSQAN
jgi:putative membrane protein